MIPAAGLPVSAPLRVRDRLRAAPDGPVRVLHRGRHAVYVGIEGPGGPPDRSCVGVVSASATQVPCALRVAAPELDESLPTTARGAAYLEGGVLHLGGRPLVVGRVVDVHVAPLGPCGPRTADSATAVVIPPAAVVGFAGDGPPGGSALDDCLAAPLPEDALVRLLPDLVGRGEGLTPLGDDLVCGWLATHRAAGVATPAADHAVRELAPRTTALSAALLDCALHGEVLPQLAAYLSARGTPAGPAAEVALLAVGHTSGAGLLHGARLALAALAHPIGAVA